VVPLAEQQIQRPEDGGEPGIEVARPELESLEEPASTFFARVSRFSIAARETRKAGDLLGREA
jgi:hypothetical protein